MFPRGSGPTDSTRAHTRARPHETCTILDGRDAGEMIPLRSARPDNPGTFVSSPPCCGFRVEHRSRMGLEVAQSTPRLMRKDFLCDIVEACYPALEKQGFSGMGQRHPF